MAPALRVREREMKRKETTVCLSHYSLATREIEKRNELKRRREEERRWHWIRINAFRRPKAKGIQEGTREQHHEQQQHQQQHNINISLLLLVLCSRSVQQAICNFNCILFFCPEQQKITRQREKVSCGVQLLEHMCQTAWLRWSSHPS